MDLKQINRIELTEVAHSFELNQQRVSLFENLSLCLEQGKSYAITGPSGSGKSSLLMLMSGLEQPTSGNIVMKHACEVGGTPVKREQIGFIFQQFHLLPELTSLANVALPLRLRGIRQAEQKAEAWLTRVGLAHRLNHKPKQLSGGEQQRVAIARALVFDPGFIFADEPTGNLDGKSAATVADILFSCCKEKGAALVLVTHSNELASRAESILRLSNGAWHVEK